MTLIEREQWHWILFLYYNYNEINFHDQKKHESAIAIVRTREVIKIVYAQRLAMNVKFEPIR